MSATSLEAKDNRRDDSGMVPVCLTRAPWWSGVLLYTRHRGTSECSASLVSRDLHLMIVTYF